MAFVPQQPAPCIQQLLTVKLLNLVELTNTTWDNVGLPQGPGGSSSSSQVDSGEAAAAVPAAGRPSILTLPLPLPLPLLPSGPLAVKAAVWTVVEKIHARGWGLVYVGPINTPSHVRRPSTAAAEAT
jgi:hypothetical protein